MQSFKQNEMSINYEKLREMYNEIKTEKEKLYENFIKLNQENFELKRWWMNAMAADTASIREKMTLFWHGHFTSKFEIDEVMPAPSMYRQNLLFRNNTYLCGYYSSSHTR
jgi:uncharacterized protein (DUF1800 family)